ncbi:MAG: hypothetical protein EXR36_05090 [Betaproteobacteria bacterium]|nr:hypothetical protein [Betaproteobacteria bacterium]
MKNLAHLYIVLLLSLASIQVATAEGDPKPTYQREAAMQKYKGCKYTDEMGKHLYECVKKNGGFGTHWCFDESLETFCPKPSAAAPSTVTPSSQ